jgi:glucose/arabinose dehydrogenase
MRVSGQVQSPAMPEIIPQAKHDMELKPFFSADVHFKLPVWFGEVPGFTNRFVVLEHAGKSWLITRTAQGDEQSSLLDLSSEVRFGGATGLLGLAFHPHFSENHKYYLKYQVLRNDRIVTVLMERQFRPDFSGDAGVPPREVLAIEGVTQDHNGGCIAFGPDGYLYLGMGDTGPQRDPQGHAQDLSLLLGKILRIDVEHQENGRNYAIPKDNPFVGRANVRPEIWAYGFREPWRFTFDSVTGDLWVGDVGQDSFEEVTMPRAGENHGWNVYEGVTPYSDSFRQPGEKYIPPVFSYSHHKGVSITGGYVYHGEQAPLMVGRYICGDFQTQRIWALTQTDRTLTSVVEIGRSPSRFATFGQDSAGELYIAGYDSGLIYKMDLSQVNPAPREVKVIAQTSEHEPVLWRYTIQSPASGWENAAFDDSPWKISSGGFGTQGTPGAIVRSEWRTGDIWLRREFDYANSTRDSQPGSLILRIHHDEDVEVYLNGVEIAHEPHWTSGYVELPLSKAGDALRSGHNILAIHCHQNTGGQYIDAGLFEAEGD